MTLLQRLWTWLRQRLGGPQRYAVVRSAELPDQPDPKTIYLTGDGEEPWFVEFFCPCGCNETLHLSVLMEGRPRWTVTHHSDGTITLAPSVWRQVGCRSHFWVRRSRVQWCP